MDNIKEIETSNNIAFQSSDAQETMNDVSPSAIEYNNELQDILHQQLVTIESLIKSNENYQCRLRSSRPKIKNTKRNTIISTKQAKDYFFVDDNGNRPPENRDTLNNMRIENNQKWTPKEIQCLKNGIQYQNQEILMSHAITTYEKSTDKEKATEKFQFKMDLISKQEFTDDTSKIDWNMISKKYVTTKDGFACREQWENETTNTPNSNTWTKEEDDKLLTLANENNGYNWKLIAEKLNHTPIQCFQRYQRSLNAKITKRKWNEKEDKQLIDLVALHGIKNWQFIADLMDGRTGQQCLHRYTKTLNPEIKKGRFKPEEDRKLELSHIAYEGNWSEIHIPNRTDVQCRERWSNYLNPDLSSKPWTKEEDSKLSNHITENGIGKWAKIAESLKGRTDNACLKRWKILNQMNCPTKKRKRPQITEEINNDK